MFIFGEPLNSTDTKLYKYEEIQLARRIMRYWTNFAKYAYEKERLMNRKQTIMSKLFTISFTRNPNGISNIITADWPLYTYPERNHIVLDVFNKSTGIAHRADYCAFWEHYIPILLEEFGKNRLLLFNETLFI